MPPGPTSQWRAKWRSTAAGDGAPTGRRAAGGYVAIVSHLHDVTGTEPLAPQSALVTGIVHALAQEGAGVAAHLIDVGDADAERLADELINGQEPVVALRGAYRWLPATTTAAPAPAGPRFKRGGVYVLPGGFGTLGRIVARHLAERFAAKVALVGRLSPDDVERHGFAAELKGLGGDAAVFAADVTDGDALAAAFAGAESRFGRIDGVVWCAGRPGSAAFAPLPTTGWDLAATQFAAKGPGLAALEWVLDKRTVDFCVLFSSVAGRVGGFGLAGYASANAYLDAFVRAHNRWSPSKWLSVLWDAWVSPGEPVLPGYEESAWAAE
jgi:NAD(P)-dependent dehydrogenase (short-subunit alcohol dehydrogenase family)